MRLKSKPSALAIVLTISVLAKPGTPTNKEWPPENIDINI